MQNTLNTIPTRALNIGDEVISKNLLHANAIEKELNIIETEWSEKFDLKKNKDSRSSDEINKGHFAKNNIFRRLNVNEKNSMKNEFLKFAIKNDNYHENDDYSNEALNKKFIETTIIHKKPENFYHLRKIFLILDANDLKDDKSNNGVLIIDNNDTNSLSHFFFVEYIIERMFQLITLQTKEYILEKKYLEQSALHKKREMEEYSNKCEIYVNKKSVWYDDITNEENETILNNSETSSIQLAKSSYFLKNQNDNGETEILAKLESFNINSYIQCNNKINQRNENKIDKEFNGEEYATAKRPIPNYNKLKTEAKQQQLKIKEFFMGSLSDKESIKNNDIQIINSDEKYISENEIVRNLPIIEKYSQVEIQRNFFYEKIIKKLVIFTNKSIFNLN